MVRITEELVRKRAEHNEREIGTLEEIALHQEDIEKLEHLQNWSKGLKILLLQSNLISKIENVRKLKKLEYLNLALNNIERIENLEGCESLQKLDLTLNFIGEITSVENLQRNLFLEELYMTGNPCTDYKGYREYVISVLPQLTKLDSIEILKSERIQAMQVFDSIKISILNDQDEYKRKREFQKLNAANKINSVSSTNDTDDIDDKSFWSQPSENTPETRAEIAHRTRKAKEAKERKDEEKPKRVIKFFNKDGKPFNINEAKVDFRLQDDDENNCLVLELRIFRYLDTALLDVDVQPTYVKVLIKGKVFQLTFDEEVKTDESTAKRSQTTGYLVINMPKVKDSIRPRKHIQKTFQKEVDSKHEYKDRRREVLEIGSGIREMDYTKICENYTKKKEECILKRPLRRNDINEKVPSKEFVDNLEVPPLE